MVEEDGRSENMKVTILRNENGSSAASGSSKKRKVEYGPSKLSRKKDDVVDEEMDIQHQSCYRRIDLKQLVTKAKEGKKKLTIEDRLVQAEQKLTEAYKMLEESRRETASAEAERDKIKNSLEYEKAISSFIQQKAVKEIAEARRGTGSGLSAEGDFLVYFAHIASIPGMFRLHKRIEEALEAADASAEHRRLR